MNPGLRILLASGTLLPVPPPLHGGIERIVDGVVRALRADGHTVGLLAHPASTAAADARFDWPCPAAATAIEHLRNALALDAAERAFAPEVVHNFARLAYFGRLLPGTLPKVASYQLDPTPRTVRWAARIGGDTLRFTGCSRHIALRGARAGGVWAAIPNFVDCMRYTPTAQVADDAPLVFLSRLSPEKGAHLAIRIARRAGRRLVIAGNRGSSAAEAAYFEREIAPHLGGDGIDYVGPVDDAAKDRLLGTAAAMVLPLGWDEPFGIVMVESLACGTPVIAYPRGAAPEIVRDGVEGFLVADEDGAVAAVGRLRDVDRQACRRRVERRFDMAGVVRQYAALYRSMRR